MTLPWGGMHFRHTSIAAIAVAGVVLSVLVSVSSYRKDDRFRQEQFNRAVENRYLALKRSLDINMHVLDSLQALYVSTQDPQRSELLDRVEFKDFADDLLKLHPGIQILQWIPQVRDSERRSFEDAARADGFPDFQITERAPQGTIGKADQRQEYFPIYFTAPSFDNMQDRGLDLASDPVLWTTMEKAARSGEVAATGRMTLRGQAPDQFGIIVFAPVYRKGALTDTDEARRDHLEGFMLGVLKVADVAEQATGALKPAGVDFSINDASASSGERFLYLHGSRLRDTPLAKEEPSGTSFQQTKTVDVAGREWVIRYSATPDFLAASDNLAHWGLLLAGLAITGLVAGFLAFCGKHATQVEDSARDISNTNALLLQEMAERRHADEELRKEEFLLSESQRVGHIGSFLDDMSSRILWSDELYRLYGVSPDTFTPNMNSFLDLIHPDDRAELQTWIGACVARERPGPVDFRVTKSDGTTSSLRAWGEAVHDDEGKLIYLVGTVQDVTERKHAEEELRRYSADLESKNNELQEALAEVKQLTGLLPICASCKKIRDDSGYWSGVETYVSKRTDAVFSHGLCPECEARALEEVQKLIEEKHEE